MGKMMLMSMRMLILSLMMGACVSQIEDGYPFDEAADTQESEEYSNPLYEKLVNYGKKLGVPCSNEITLCADMTLSDLEMMKDVVCSKSKEFTQCVIKRCELASKFQFVIKGAVEMILTEIGVKCSKTEHYAESDARDYGNLLSNPSYDIAYPQRGDYASGRISGATTDSEEELCEKVTPVCKKMLQKADGEACARVQEYVRCLETECNIEDLIKQEVVRDGLESIGIYDGDCGNGQVPLRLGGASAAFLLVALVTIKNLFYGF
ncbi:hypothetical protein RRG08_054446 [Elysia crispata]|uniref:Uncharacterized protein n=1 Tax=Elysia crispata TaxID=231223 RepID=A0AAE1E5J2_9GAST|nr:hypothetical protein RRG08_054446 [Elysia crispata]